LSFLSFLPSPHFLRHFFSFISSSTEYFYIFCHPLILLLLLWGYALGSGERGEKKEKTKRTRKLKEKKERKSEEKSNIKLQAFQKEGKTEGRKSLTK